MTRWPVSPPAQAGRAAARGAIPSTGTNALRNAVLLTNNYILENHEDLNMFATLFFGLLDPSNGQLAYINAGHNPPFILGPDGTVKAALKGTGPAVGMFPATDFRIDYAQMDPGDILYLYTDGVTEARDPDRAFFTEKRLLALSVSQRTRRPVCWSASIPACASSWPARPSSTISPCWLCSRSPGSER